MTFVDVMPYSSATVVPTIFAYINMKCSLVLLSSEYCKEVFLCPEFEPFLEKVMAGPSTLAKYPQFELSSQTQQHSWNWILLCVRAYLGAADMVCRKRFRHGLQCGSHAGGHYVVFWLNLIKSR
jgi:hypothetical protein